MKKILITFLGLFVVAQVFAQPRMEGRMPHEKEDFPTPQHRERMEQMMAYKMTEDLKLTTEQSEKFFPMLKEHHDKIEKIEKEINEITNYINEKIIKGKNISDKELDKVFERIHSLEKNKIDERAQYLDDLKNVLNNIQRAKFVTFKDRFARGVEERLKMKREELGRERERLQRKMEELEKYNDKLNEIGGT